MGTTGLHQPLCLPHKTSPPGATTLATFGLPPPGQIPKTNEHRCHLPQGAAQELTARKTFAEVQAKRYATLLVSQSVSEEGASIKRQELTIATANLAAAGANLDASR